MKKVLYSMLALFVMATTAQAATDYGFYVGGVKVNSDNYTQIVEKSSVISKGTVTYNHSTKTLTLTDVKMSRTGDNNNGIDNYGCDGLKIVFKGTNELVCKDASVIQCQKNTTISCATGSQTEIRYRGTSYRAIYLWGADLTITGAGNLKILAVNNDGSPKGIEGKNATETLTINHSSDLVINAYGNSLRDLGKVVFDNTGSTTLTAPFLNVQAARVENVKAMTFKGYQHIDSPTNVSYNSTEKSITNSSGTHYVNEIVINAEVIWLNKPNDNIPDANFRQALREIFNRDYIFSYEAVKKGEISVTDKGIASLQGIELFTNLQTLNCDNNQLTTLDVSKNKLLKNLSCCGNQLTKIDVSNNLLLKTLQISNNQLTSLDVTNQKYIVTLDCSYNKLTQLDVSKIQDLEKLYCNNNMLTSISRESPLNLKEIYIYSNRLLGNGMAKFLGALFKYYVLSGANLVVINSADPNEQNVITMEQVNIGTEKYYKVYDYAYMGEDYPGLASSTGLSFSATTATATVGEPFTAPTLNNPNSHWISGITYSSSNPKVATVNSSTGDVKLIGAGTTKITASYGGRPHYFPADNVSYTLTVSGSTGIETVMNEQPEDGCWYTLNGQKLQGEPTQKGIYIYKGKKIVK